MELTTNTFKRPDNLDDLDDPRVLYARSYLLIRMVVGSIGVLLPTLLFIIDSGFLPGPASVRGSLSAYYHTSARDLFVGALCVTGFFLVTYMSGQKSTWDYWLSTIAGIAALGVAFIPTSRPNIAPHAARCGDIEVPPPGCTQLQHSFGEVPVASVHYASAGVFILSLAVLCFVFARREERHSESATRSRFHRACGIAIVAAVSWIAVGESLGLSIAGVEPLYVGEVVSVYAFGASWLMKAKDLFAGVTRRIARPPSPRR